MSRAWMPWYIGDYLRDTGHLTTEQHGAYLLLLAHCWQHGSIPADHRERAAVVRLSPKRWKTIGQPVAKFFKTDGTHGRVTMEIEKTERAIMQRTLAGTRGGQKSAISRAIKRGQEIASAQAGMKRSLASRLPPVEAKLQAETEQPRTNHNHKDTSLAEQASEEAEPTATSLATALPAGALARSPEAEQVSRKRPADVSKEELEAMYAARREAKLQHTGH